MIRIEVDFKRFKMGLIDVIGKTDRASKEGMESALKAYLDDALDVPPSCPTKSGSLAGSHSIFVDSKLIETSESRHESGGEGPTPLRALVGKAKGLVGTLVVHKRYAASIHEGVSRWGTPYKFKKAGQGKKWIEAKAIKFGEKYFRMIAGRIKATK